MIVWKKHIRQKSPFFTPLTTWCSPPPDLRSGGEDHLLWQSSAIGGFRCHVLKFGWGEIFWPQREMSLSKTCYRGDLGESYRSFPCCKTKAWRLKTPFWASENGRSNCVSTDFFQTPFGVFGGYFDGNPAPVEVGSLSHYLQGFIHARWLFGISSINSMLKVDPKNLCLLWQKNIDGKRLS